MHAWRDVVVVTVNHRLNAFGYLYLGEFDQRFFAESGNVGRLISLQHCSGCANTPRSSVAMPAT